MAKLLGLIASFVLGLIMTAGLGWWLWTQNNPSTTEVWTTADELHLDGGVVIPEGVELIQERWMPEGFVTLKLYVNVDGAALDRFERRTEPQRNLVIPTWVEQ